MYKIGFTGTRRGLTLHQINTLITYLKYLALINNNGIELHHGCCIGADETAALIARVIGARVVGHPPVNHRFISERLIADELRDACDYIGRNHNIVDEVDEMIAGPDTMEEQLRSGTWSTVRYTRQVAKPLTILDPNPQ